MKSYNILFLCTGNSARSILAEALVTTLSSGKFIGYSAGSNPAGRVNPFASELAIEMGYPKEKLRSKNWDEYSLPDSHHKWILLLRYVITQLMKRVLFG
jgi:arsenate reductase (thioredoxin)